MIAYLIEHFAGAFPVWLSPTQAMIVSVSDKQVEYCTNIYKLLLQHGIRVELNLASETMSYKIRSAVIQKIPYIVIIGDQEATSQTVSIRDRKGAQKNNLSVDIFIQEMCKVIKSKSLELWD